MDTQAKPLEAMLRAARAKKQFSRRPNPEQVFLSMPSWRKTLFYSFPVVFLWVPGALGLALEAFNRYYRNLSTPFLLPSLGLFLVSGFFWIRRKNLYLLWILVNLIFLGFLIQSLILTTESNLPLVRYYESWEVKTESGLIRLHKPAGNYPPRQGAYVSCHFPLQSLRDYWNLQPNLCSGFDESQRVEFFIDDQVSSGENLREIQINYFYAERKSLLGEPLDRWALRLAYLPEKNHFGIRFKLKSIYQVYEREIENGKTKIVESFSRNGRGQLKSFTESPKTKFSDGDIYALYGPEGELVEIPQKEGRQFSFPAKVDIRDYKNYQLPSILRPIRDSLKTKSP